MKETGGRRRKAAHRFFVFFCENKPASGELRPYGRNKTGLVGRELASSPLWFKTGRSLFSHAKAPSRKGNKRENHTTMTVGELSFLRGEIVTKTQDPFIPRTDWPQRLQELGHGGWKRGYLSQKITKALFAEGDAPQRRRPAGREFQKRKESPRASSLRQPMALRSLLGIPPLLPCLSGRRGERREAFLAFSK